VEKLISGDHLVFSKIMYLFLLEKETVMKVRNNNAPIWKGDNNSSQGSKCAECVEYIV
jgi:hypothetical protein